MSDDLARDVLVHWALPLLARARHAADHHADPMATPLSWETWEMLADDIAALIGHPVTDQPPAPELDEVLARADLPPVREKLVDSARLGTAEHFRAARNVARSAAPKKEQGPARRVACDGCGARPGGDACLAPDGRHTWRPLPTEPRIAGVAVGPGVDPAEARALMDQLNATRGHAPDTQAVHAPTRHDRPAHTLAPCPTDGAPCIRWCPGRQRCAQHVHRWVGTHDRGPRCATCDAPKPGPDDDKAEAFRQGWLAGEAAGRESGESAAPTRTPGARP